jgi:hypothetical protein
VTILGYIFEAVLYAALLLACVALIWEAVPRARERDRRASGDMYQGKED